MLQGDRVSIRQGWAGGKGDTTNVPVAPAGAEGLMTTDGVIPRPGLAAALLTCWCRFVRDEPGEPAAEDADGCDEAEV